MYIYTIILLLNYYNNDKMDGCTLFPYNNIYMYIYKIIMLSNIYYILI